MLITAGSALGTIRRLAVIAVSGIVLLALHGPTARAAPAASATTLPATFVNSTSAVLNGTIDTRGQETEWQFQYGSTTAYGRTTPLGAIPPGQRVFHVSASITGLKPNTRYHFRLLAITGISPYMETDDGADRNFKTKPLNGRLVLLSSKLHVSKGVVSVPLRCTSTRACAGRFSIDTRSNGQERGTIVCATKSFKIRARKTSHVRANVSPACRALLAKASHHRLKSTFVAAMRTNQRGLFEPITLIRG